MQYPSMWFLLFYGYAGPLIVLSFAAETGHAAKINRSTLL